MLTSVRTSPRPKIVRISSSAADRGPGAELGRLVDVEQRLLVEKLDPQERPHALRERLLELDQRVLG